jgi:phage shock protein C
MAKRLVKGKKMIFGVCSGLGNYLSLDVTVVRALFLGALLLFGAGLLLYLLLALIMPSR